MLLRNFGPALRCNLFFACAKKRIFTAIRAKRTFFLTNKNNQRNYRWLFLLRSKPRISKSIIFSSIIYPSIIYPSIGLSSFHLKKTNSTFQKRFEIFFRHISGNRSIDHFSIRRNQDIMRLRIIIEINLLK